MKKVKKVYCRPEAEIIRFKAEDVITTSGISSGGSSKPNKNGKPGHGWGDGGHTGPPGQNKKH